MRLAYLGKVEGSTAPTMFEAWTLDRDPANQEVASVSIRVLLSRSQLSDLAATVSALYDAFKKGRDDPNSFYEQLRSAALTLSRDPNKIQAAGNRNLSDAILGEYLDGLPYASRVMAMDEDQWTREMSPGDQEELIDSMAVKLELYRHMQDDVSHWVKLAPDAAPEDAVYPVPLDALP
jgi:serine/threonine-protein kinase PpkA